jgi:hypothetical protein
MGWVVIGAGITAAALLPIHSGCRITNEFNCDSGIAIRVGILAGTAVVAAILFIAAWSE